MSAGRWERVQVVSYEHGVIYLELMVDLAGVLYIGNAMRAAHPQIQRVELIALAPFAVRDEHEAARLGVRGPVERQPTEPEALSESIADTDSRDPHPTSTPVKP